MSRIPDLPDGTLLVSGWHTDCNNCGKNVDPGVETHEDVIGYHPEKGGGCGIKFTHISSMYIGSAEKVVKNMRPDLEYIAPMPLSPDVSHRP